MLAWSVAPSRAPRPDATWGDSMTPDPGRTNSTVADLHPWQQPASDTLLPWLTCRTKPTSGTDPVVRSTAHNAPVCAKAATFPPGRAASGVRDPFDAGLKRRRQCPRWFITARLGDWGVLMNGPVTVLDLDAALDRYQKAGFTIEPSEGGPRSGWSYVTQFHCTSSRFHCTSSNAKSMIRSEQAATCSCAFGMLTSVAATAPRSPCSPIKPVLPRSRAPR